LTSSISRAGRVAFLITSSSGGGAEQQVRSLALAFRERGWDVGVVTMLPLEPFLADLAGRGIRVASLGMARGIPDPRALVRLARLLRRWRPDVLHGHMVHANLLARLSRLLVRTPAVVSTMHNQDEGAQWRYVAYRVTDRLSDVTTTVSHAALEAAVRRGATAKERIRLVPNGIDLADHRPDPAARAAARAELGVTDEFVWLAVGRLVAAKAYPDMIAAFRQIAGGVPGAVLAIAGDGPLEAETRSAIREAGLDGQIRLLGRRPDVPALMQAADGFVMSSAWEGLPIVLLEAAASGLPIVATNVGGSHDAIVDGASGFITPPGDPGALATAMRAVMDAPNIDRRAMGDAARAHMARVFDIETVAATWEGIYRDLLAGRGR
jgi:glycosyltransferase involved in cell wall biosynthesis